VLLQAGTELLSGHERPRVLVRLGLAALQMPLLILTLSWSFERAKRQRLGARLEEHHEEDDGDAEPAPCGTARRAHGGRIHE
jgi:hypothetical protein